MRVANDNARALRVPRAFVDDPSLRGPAIDWARHVKMLDTLGEDDPLVARGRIAAVQSLGFLLGRGRHVAVPEKPGANVAEWKEFGAWAGRLPDNEPLKAEFRSLARRGLMQAMEVGAGRG